MRVLYNLGPRLNNELSAREVVKIHYLHADDNNHKVLFTTDKMLAEDKMHKITEIILTSKDGQTAMVGRVIEVGKYDNDDDPPFGFEKPSLWNNENKNGKMWFAIEDVSKISNGIQRGMYMCQASNKDVLDSINSDAYIVYYI